ncbi:MAG: NfeD family protein [bacterium]
MLKPTPVFWIVAGLVVAALEMVVPGFVIIWFGVAAVVTGIVAFFVPSPVAQLAVFAVLSGALVAASQFIARRITRPEPEPVGAHRWLGAQGIVLADIRPPELGRVKILGEEWRARAGSAIEAGRTVRVREVSGTHLVVEPWEEGSKS